MRIATLLAAGMLSVAPAGAMEAPPLDLVQPVRGPIVRHFEPPPDPYGPGHRGLDLAAPEGSAVRAAAAGTVAFAGQVGGRLHVSIDHAGGYRTSYSFLGSIGVRAGQVVAQDERLASSGTGHDGSEEPHLHFGLRLDGDYVDPEPLLIASVRRNLWRVVRLAPEATAERGTMP